MDFQALLSIVAALLTVVAFAALPLTWFRKAAKHEKVEKDHLEARMIELGEAIARHESIKRRAGLSDTALTIGQYIIGGVLASSFVQTALSALVGSLGVLVLVSSLVRKHFEPERQYRGACERLALLNKLRRNAQDELASAHSSRESAPSRYKIARVISQGLHEIEMFELEANSVGERSKPAVGDSGSP